MDSFTPVQNIVLPISGLLISGLWISYRQGLLKKIISYYQWMDKKGVVVDSFIFITAPFIASTLGSYILGKGTQEIVKSLIPVGTFILGQYVVLSLRRQEKETKEKAIMFSIWEELMHNCLILNENVSLLKKEEENAQAYYTGQIAVEPLISLKTDFWDKMKYDFYVGHRYVNNNSEKTGGLIIVDSKHDNPKQLVANTFMRIYSINRLIDTRNSKVKYENSMELTAVQYRSEALNYGRLILCHGEVLLKLIEVSMNNIAPLIYDDVDPGSR